MFPPVKSSNNANNKTEDATNSCIASTISNNATQTPNGELSPPEINAEMRSETHHQNPRHCLSSFTAINQMRSNSQLCDITLDVDGETIVAHKVILASVSPYFYAMFNDDMLERTQGIVTIQDIKVDAMRLLIDYIYTGEITITERNVQILLPASSLFQMHSVREACCKFLLNQLHPSNCLGIRSFADAHSCKELHSRSHEYALQNFEQVMASEEFLLLSFEEINNLISNNQLNISSEEKVFHAVINWINHNLEERQHFTCQLMSHVRLPLVNRDFLMSLVEGEPLLKDDAQCKELLLEAMKYHLLPEQRSLMCTERTQERKPSGVKPYVFAVGGGSLFAIHNECEVFNPRSNSWTPIAPMLWRRSRAGVTALDRTLYVVGGYDGVHDLATAECYLPTKNKWSYITPMGTKRSCLGICSYDGLIYVCGGYDGASCLSSTERYDPLTSIWSSCTAMSTRRRYCRLSVLDNCIYALGGFDSTNYQSSVERFDPRVGRWYAVTSMTARRSSCGVTSCGGYLYCIGGNDGTICMSSGERFNIRCNTWEPISAMHFRRSTHEIVEIEGIIYALGGNDGSSSLNTVERYDTRTNKWTIVNSMVARRSSVGAAVLDCLNLEHSLLQTSLNTSSVNEINSNNKDCSGSSSSNTSNGNNLQSSLSTIPSSSISVGGLTTVSNGPSSSSSNNIPNTFTLNAKFLNGQYLMSYANHRISDTNTLSTSAPSTIAILK